MCIAHAPVPVGAHAVHCTVTVILFLAHASWEFAAMMRYAQAISFRGKVVPSAQHNLLRLAISHCTCDYGQTSSWYAKGWAPSKSTYSGWSKRATRGYQANYDLDDRRHEWDDHASRVHRLLQISRLWTNATRTREWPLRTMPQAVEQIPPPWSLWETLLQKGMPYHGDWENSIAC